MVFEAFFNLCQLFYKFFYKIELVIKMAKEKKLKELEEKDYFKELLAFFILILMIIFIGNLGVLGFYGNLVFKIIFGEWSFILLALIFLASLFYMIKGHTLSFSSLSFQGFILIYLALALFCHLTIYNSLGLNSKNVFAKTIELYKNYFKNYDESYYVGGGLIGLFLFQVVIILLGKAGIILVGLSMLIMGVSYLMNRSVWDFIKRYKHLFIFSGRLKSKLLTYFKKLKIYKEPNIDLNKRNRPTLSLLDDIKDGSNQILQKEVNKNIEYVILDTIKSYNLNTNLVNTYLGCSSTTFLLKDSNSDDLALFKKKINQDAFYFTDKFTHLEVSNKFKELLTLKRVHLMLKDSPNLPLGLDNMESIICLDETEMRPHLVIGANGSGLKTFLHSLIISVILIYKTTFTLMFFDLKKEFKELKGLSSNYLYRDNLDEIAKKIDDLVFEFDKRFELLKYLDVSDYLKANEEISKKDKNMALIKKTFIFLNLNLEVLASDAKEKIKYLIQVGPKVGYYIFLIKREEETFRDINLSLYNLLIFKLNDISLSLKLINSDIGCNLQGKGDFILAKKEKISHGQAPFCSMTDYLKVLEKITF